MDFARGTTIPRRKFPALRRVYRRSYLLRLTDGTLVNLTFLLLPRVLWLARPERSPGSGWYAWRVGAFVIAFRLDC
jgi:hypothetical protein